MSNTPVKVGVIGCGTISPVYFRSAKWLDSIEIVACADIFREAAEAKAKEFNVPNIYSVDELLADPEIEIVINLTIPKVHGTIGLQVLETGKSVYNEKPLALTRAEGQQMLAMSKEKGGLAGGAPDTFLGGGIQTCRQLIDSGVIGEPLAATAFMLSPGHESWHPAPEFYYKPGGGPMFDMGPYYLTALVSLLGSVKRVTGSARISRTQRTITSEPKKGQIIDVEVPTHIAGVMDFESGVIGTLVTSFDVQAANVPRIEIYGTEATLSVPDPNTFGGPVEIKRSRRGQWEDIALTHGYVEQSRGLGVADMANALRSGRAHRANGELTYHVLDIMHAFHDASDTGQHIMMESRCDRPAPLPVGLAHGTLDA
ncbi:MAG: Gfo/Idh/MocA family oxidoreductase [Chloroflexota bacterium]